MNPMAVQKSPLPIKRPRGRPVGSTLAPETIKQRINVTLDAQRQDIARLAGDGNLSGGLRVALDAWAKTQSKKKTLPDV